MFIKKILLGLMFFMYGFHGVLMSNEPPLVMHLRDHLKKAKKGDFIVTSQNKNYTLIHIFDHQPKLMVIEEITVPESRIQRGQVSWKAWIKQGALGHTSWIHYLVDLEANQVTQAFSLANGQSRPIIQVNPFLNSLLNLKFTLVPPHERKKVNGRDKKGVWNPPLVFEGKVIPGVMFNAWRARWPKDSSPLSGKMIEAYLPQVPGPYPDYFPYWLQVSGIGGFGKAKVFVIDGGSKLDSSGSFPQS